MADRREKRQIAKEERRGRERLGGDSDEGGWWWRKQGQIQPPGIGRRETGVGWTEGKEEDAN